VAVQLQTSSSELGVGQKNTLVYNDPSHTDRRNKTIRGTASRIEPVAKLWELSNDTIPWQRFIDNDEANLSELISSNNELLARFNTTSTTSRSLKNIMLRSTIQDTIDKQASEIEFLNTMIEKLRLRLAEVKSAREIFDIYFNKSYDEAELLIKDTLMVLNIVIDQRLKDVDFQRVEVLSVTEIEKASNLLVQIECENMSKTEAALATFHESNLRHLQPDLRPDKYPEDLWAITDDTLKEAAKQAWEKFTPEPIDIVIPELLKIDISKETTSRRREEPYIRAQIFANINAWVYPNMDDPPMIDTPFEYKINLIDPKDKPYKCKQRRFSILERFSLRARCLNMLDKKKIQQSSSNWASPPRMVAYDERIRKFLEEHGENTMEALQSIGTDRKMRDMVQNLYRFTSDMRKVNVATVLEIFPLHNIPDLINSCSNKERYTCLDIEDAFFVVRCAEESRPITAFITPDGLFEYTVMVQGGKCSANVFAKIVSDIFTPLQGKEFFWYQDDLVNHEDKSITSHMDMQQLIYSKCIERRVILKPSKAHMNYTSQRVLGYIMSKEGRRVDPSLVDAINKIAPPKTLQGIQSLLGLAQVAREYIPGLATLIAPLQKLSRKGVDVEAEWKDEEQGEALRNLQTVLTNAPVLLIPDMTKKFRVHVDCCRVGRGCGAVLLQENDQGAWQPVAYWSRGLTAAERKLSATALEATAMHDAILHWKIYLSTSPFDVITDHYALVYMVTKMEGYLHGRISRMVMDLQGFTFTVTHRSGVLHLDADAVSRLLQVDEEPYVNTVDDLRDDFGPLSEADKATIASKYPFSDDAKKVADIIDKFRTDRQKEGMKPETFLSKSSPKKQSKATPSDPIVPAVGKNVDEYISKADAQAQFEERNVHAPVIVRMPKDPWAQLLLDVNTITPLADDRSPRLNLSDGIPRSSFWTFEECEDSQDFLITAPIQSSNININSVDMWEHSQLIFHPFRNEEININAVTKKAEPQRSARIAEAIIKAAATSAAKLVKQELQERQQEDKKMRAVRHKMEKAEADRSKLGTPGDKKLSKEEQAEDVAHTKLEQFNGLVRRCFRYNPPSTDGEVTPKNELYIVLNTFRNKSKDHFMATIVRYDDEAKLQMVDADQLLTLPIMGRREYKN
jgi:hypothetical protein